jgi:AAA domain
LGASGTGKTTALTQLGRTHELHTRKRYPADRHRLPVLYVTVPPAATARMLAVEFARFLGLEFTGRANITDIVNAVCATAAHTRVELVCVDELHNLNLATRAGAEVSDQLKYFAERLPATFVYAGSVQSTLWVAHRLRKVSLQVDSSSRCPSRARGCGSLRTPCRHTLAVQRRR